MRLAPPPGPPCVSAALVYAPRKLQHDFWFGKLGNMRLNLAVHRSRFLSMAMCSKFRFVANLRSQSVFSMRSSTGPKVSWLFVECVLLVSSRDARTFCESRPGVVRATIASYSS